MHPDLAAADRLRDTDPAAALKIYAQHQDGISPTDDERIAWICDQVAPTPPAALRPLLERAANREPGLTRRAALHALATCAWYEGLSDEAEEYWRRGLHEADGVRDRLWIRSCLNLANALFSKSCLFEPLVLAGMGKRAAVDADLPYLQAYAACRISDILTKIGDQDRARGELTFAEEAMPLIQVEGERRVIVDTTLLGWAELHRTRKEWGAERRLRGQHVRLLEEYGSTEDPLLASAHMEYLRVLFELEPEGRAEQIREFEAIPERFEVRDAWHVGWQRKYTELRMRYALETKEDRDEALRWGRKRLELIRDFESEAGTAMAAAELGRAFANDLGAPQDAREAFDLAATSSLRRIAEAHRSVQEIPVLKEATPEDWMTLGAYRQRLADEQRELLDTVAAYLRPGGPAFDLLVHEELLRLCAWCRRVRIQDGTWLPVSHFLPQGCSFGISHGICEPCRERHFPAVAAAVAER